MNEEQGNSQKQQQKTAQKGHENWDSAQEWMNEHKVITAIAAAILLYLLGGRRIKQIANFAVKSGVTAGIANAAMGTIIPQSKPATEEGNVYH